MAEANLVARLDDSIRSKVQSYYHLCSLEEWVSEVALSEFNEMR
jgi:hypothetical protein